ncbi:MAG TPA: hypothetical protein ENK44_00010 [Caldithrix abyssi]|uniref:HEAT repeat domain-containing protein n=1 Tax=Caldithrix abyssi TaxID=187145 RepID=A0A7V4TX97_CALAY|nr:hypothetical protein [Caldithrix abyssi]
MKHFIVIIATLLFGFTALFAQNKPAVDWEAYGEQLVNAIGSTNKGVQLSAMRHIIRYGDSLEVVMARYVVMDKFMNEKDQKIRLLALATLATINNPLDIGLLELHYKWEKDPEVKKMLEKVLADKGRLSFTRYQEK